MLHLFTLFQWIIQRLWNRSTYLWTNMLNMKFKGMCFLFVKFPPDEPFSRTAFEFAHSFCSNFHNFHLKCVASSKCIFPFECISIAIKISINKCTFHFSNKFIWKCKNVIKLSYIFIYLQICIMNGIHRHIQNETRRAKNRKNCMHKNSICFHWDLFLELIK